MRSLSTSLVIAIACLMNIIAVSAQSTVSYGVFCSYNANRHSADFRAFPGVASCCPAYQDGSGSGAALGLLSSLSLSPSLRAELRLGMNSLNGQLQRDEAIILSGNILGTFRHSVESALQAYSAEISAEHNVIAALWLRLGVRANILSKKNFTQKELLTNPTTGVFENGSRARNVVIDSTIPNAQSLQSQLIAGVSYELPLNTSSSFKLCPEVSYALALSQVVSDVEWKVHQVHLGLSLRYSPPPRSETPQRRELREEIDTLIVQGIAAQNSFIQGTLRSSETKEQRDGMMVTTQLDRRTDTLVLAKAPSSTVSVEPVTPNLSMTLNTLGVDNTEQLVERVVVEDFVSLPSTPLLNYIFFDEGSSEIPARYTTLNSASTTQFKESVLDHRDRLKCYYQLLNIVGLRMKAHPNAVLTLIGCNADIALEKSNTELSRKRAESVRSYLHDAWNIETKRIQIESRSLPSRASNSLSIDGAQENRRVEIASNDASILDALTPVDTVQKINPPSLSIRLRDKNSSRIDSWSLTFMQGSSTLKTFESTGALPSMLEWKINDDAPSLKSAAEVIVGRLSVRSNAKEFTKDVRLAVDHISIEKKRIEHRQDKEIARYSLMTFDVRSAEIPASSKRVMDLIRKQIHSNSEVSVIGYADRSGEQRTNQQLAEERARATAKELGVPIKNENIVGVANSTVYNPDLPEGRFYARTVEVVIETPIEHK